MTRINVFGQHPTGFRVHFELTDDRIPQEAEGQHITSGEATNILLKNLAILSKWMIDQGYTGEYANGGSAPSQGATEAPAASGTPCPECGGPTEYKTGTSKKNKKPWAGYFCLKTKDRPREAQHAPVWEDVPA